MRLLRAATGRKASLQRCGPTLQPLSAVLLVELQFISTNLQDYFQVLLQTLCPPRNTLGVPQSQDGLVVCMPHRESNTEYLDILSVS